MQWNARGLISKWPIVKPFFMDMQCDVMCIQETHFLPVDFYDFGLLQCIRQWGTTSWWCQLIREKCFTPLSITTSDSFASSCLFN